MALVAKPFGLAPQRTTDANFFSEQGTFYSLAAADANAWYIGDAFLSTNNADANGLPAMKKATVGTETLRGVMLGNINPPPGQVTLQGISLALENTAIPASKNSVVYYILGADDAGIVFTIQDDGITTGSLVAANANKNFSLTITNGATLQSNSASVMLSSSLATTAGLNMKAMGLAQTSWQGQTNAFGGFGLWLCKINQHEFMGNTAGV
jgi:hypothetical protein